MCCNKNQPFNLDSSETTREAPFYKLQKYRPQHIKTNDVTFLEWFIGFSEGDGCFLVSDQKTRCSFIIVQKDISLLYKIRTCLGFGNINIYTQKGQI